MDENDLRWILKRTFEIATSNVPDGYYCGWKRPGTLKYVFRDKVFYASRAAIKEWFKTFRPNIDPYKKATLNAHLVRVISRLITWGWRDWYVQSELQILNEVESL